MFKTKSVESILSSFNKIIEQLDAVSDNHSLQIDANTQLQAQIEKDTQERVAEVEKAASVKAKIQALIS